MEKKSPHEHGLIRIVAFILLFCVLLVSYSYLIRPTFLFTESLTGLEEEEAPIDVLFVGGSSTLVYWSPLFAFERYGLSSYNLSDSAMAPALMQGMLRMGCMTSVPYPGRITVLGCRVNMTEIFRSAHRSRKRSTFAST